MRLAELLPEQSALDIEITGLAEHNDEVFPGCAFVAVAGDPQRAAEHARKAVDAGAAAVLATTRLDLPDAVPQVVVQDLVQNRGAIASRYYGGPSEQLACIGVTGTNGKTSIAYHISDLGRLLGVSCGYIGTLGKGLGGAIRGATLTTPNAVALQRYLAEFVEQGAQRAALEMSSHALDQGRAQDVQFDVAVFSNLTRDHLDYHETFAAYGAAKLRLFTDWPLSAAVVNSDDPFSAKIIASTQAPVVTYGVSGQWSWAIVDSTQVEWQTPEGRASAQLPIAAEFAVANLTAAMAVLCNLGHPLADIVRHIPAMTAVPGRLEMVGKTKTGALVVVDYAHTPDALEKVLRGLRSVCKGRLVCVFGCGGDRDRGKRASMGRIAQRNADVLWITSDNPRSESPLQILADIREGLESAPWREEVDRAAAICGAITEANTGDVVVIAGKGHENYQEIEGQKLPFDDRQVARSALEAA